MAYNKRQHLADNMNGYTGFGGLKCILNPAEKDTDIGK